MAQSTLRLCLLLTDDLQSFVPLPAPTIDRRLGRPQRGGRRRRRIHPYRDSMLREWILHAEFGRRSWEWVAERSTDWWDRIVCFSWADEEWLRCFRMTRATFYELVEVITPHLQRQTMKLREPIPVNKRLGVALWYLNSKSTYLKVRQQFGVSLSMASEITIEVCLALQIELLQKTVCLGGSVGTIMDGFANLGFPHCIGAIDGSHIRIKRPGENEHQYVNRKGFHSVLLQGTVDHTGQFIDVEIGWGGRNHDAFVFRYSEIFRAMSGGTFVPGNPTISMGGVRVPALIIADAAYPIRAWLMKPYSRTGTQRERHFNHALSKARTVLECAFGQLKLRWRCLNDRLEVSLDKVDCIVTAGVILHSICEMKGHDIVGELCTPSELPPPPSQPLCRREDERHKQAGEAVRNAVAEFLWQNGLIAQA